MKLAILLVLFTLGTSDCFCQISISEKHKTYLYKNETFSFLMQRNKTILSVRIGNSRPLKIILDSGMSFDGLLIYNPDLQDSIKLKNAVDIQIAGAGSGNPSNGKMADSMSFAIGDVEFKDQKVLILANDNYKGFPTDGVIGYSLFGHYGVEINNDDCSITLHDYEDFLADSSWKIIPLTFKENKIPWVETFVSVGEETPVKMSMYIDYASRESIELLIHPDMKYKLPENLSEYYLGRGLSGDIYGKKGKVSKVTVGDYVLENVSTAFAPSEVRSKQKGADGILGNNFFKRFNVIFNYAEKNLYLKPSNYFNNDWGRIE